MDVSPARAAALPPGFKTKEGRNTPEAAHRSFDGLVALQRSKDTRRSLSDTAGALSLEEVLDGEAANVADSEPSQTVEDTSALSDDAQPFAKALPDAEEDDGASDSAEDDPRPLAVAVASSPAAPELDEAAGAFEDDESSEVSQPRFFFSCSR